MNQQKPTAWPTVKLGDLVSFTTGKLNSNAAVSQGAYPFFTCSQETLRTDTYSFDTECVLLAGNNANGIYPLKYFSGKFDAYQRTYVIRSLNSQRLVNRFLFFALQPKLELLKSISTGAATKFLTLTILRDVELDLPPLKDQHKIADILGVYDDLIQNNTRRVKILEEMAQTTYREWFVHFRFPGHDNVKMMDSEVGMIPNGWDIRPVSRLLIYQIGGGWGEEQKTEDHRAQAYVIRGTDIPAVRYQSIEGCPLRFHKQSSLESRFLRPGDIVFEVSGGSKGQPVGRALLVEDRLLAAFSEQVICASFCKLLRVDNNALMPEILYLHLREIYENGVINKYQVQSTGITNFKFSYFLQSELVAVPTRDVQSRFAKLVVPIFQLIDILGARNAILRRTRDLLLPKLIAGEVPVENPSH